ncbi:MAG: LysR family transcriptional regulator [Pseudomonadota bacterium]
MDERNFDWDDLRLFLAVARGGGLAAAAIETKKSAPTLGRRMLALERKLGCDLFRRMARGYTLTEQGEDLLARATLLESNLQPILETGASNTTPVVKVSAGTWVTHHLCKNLPSIAKDDPIRLRFIAAEDVLDIAHREAVVGIRNHRPQGLGLAARKVTKVRFAVYATDDAVASWVRVVGNTPSAKWMEAQTRNANVIEVTSPRNALDLALAGSARVVLPTFIGGTFKALREVRPPIHELEHDQWLVTHHEDRFLPEVRKVIDRIYAVLKSADGESQSPPL